MFKFHVSNSPRLLGKRRLLSSVSIAAMTIFGAGMAQAQQAPDQPPQAAPEQNPAGSSLPPLVVEKPAERPAEVKAQKEGTAERRARKRQAAPVKQPAAQTNAGGEAKDPTAYATSNATAATKTDTPIMVTPASIQVVPQQVLQDQQVITLDQALKNVSGVTVAGGGAAGFGGPYGGATLRGFTTDTIFLDGTRIDNYSSSNLLFNQPFANVDKIEVLKGPAAILYGVIEPGGIVNVVTKQPQSAPSYSIEEQAGSFGLSRTTFNATGPLTQDGSVLYRLDTSYLNQGSQVDFAYNKNFFIAPVVQWNIDQANTLKAEFNYRESNVGSNFGFIPVNSSASFPIGSIINPNPSLNYGNTSPNIDTTYFAALTWTHKFDSDWSIKERLVFKSTTVHTDEFDDPLTIVQDAGNLTASGSPLVTPSGFAVQRGIFDDSSAAQNFTESTDLTGHFNTYGVAHTLLIGGDYATFYTKGSNSLACFTGDGNCSFVDLLNPVNPGTPYSGPPSFSFNFSQFTETAGLYAQDQLKLPWNIYLLSGVRLQYLYQTSMGAPGLYDSKITPRAGILWQPRDWLSLYTSYTESFGPAAAGETTPDLKDVPPTTGTQWEYGVKTSFFGGKLTATAAYFDLTKTNIPTADPQNPNFVFVIGAARSAGEELDVQGEISPGWKVIANYAHTDARVIGTSENASPPVGSRVGGVPIDLAHLWTSYEFQEESLHGLKIGGGTSFNGRTPYETTGGTFEKLFLPDSVTFDLFTAYQFNAFDKKWTAQLNATNIFNRKYLREAELISSGPTGNFNFISGVWGTPQTIVGSLKVEF